MAIFANILFSLLRCDRTPQRMDINSRQHMIYLLTVFRRSSILYFECLLVTVIRAAIVCVIVSLLSNYLVALIVFTIFPFLVWPNPKEVEEEDEGGGGKTLKFPCNGMTQFQRDKSKNKKIRKCNAETEITNQKENNFVVPIVTGSLSIPFVSVWDCQLTVVWQAELKRIFLIFPSFYYSIFSIWQTQFPSINKKCFGFTRLFVYKLH